VVSISFVERSNTTIRVMTPDFDRAEDPRPFFLGGRTTGKSNRRLCAIVDSFSTGIREIGSAKEIEK
jgi:hypothetical protein